jgi:Dolichyl-phosphate-mannose-protein mannosyltransferase
VLVDLAIKLWIASTTQGTSDVTTWMRFATDVARVGPVDIYKIYYINAQHPALYNHPPLIGYLLMVVNLITRWGLRFPLAIRLPSILADTITPFLILELLRGRRPLRRAFAAAAWVAASPTLIVISGFHGNTDPVFVMFCLLSLYLLVERRSPLLAGFVFAIALSVKVVPVVLLPTLALFALLQGWRFLSRFALGVAALLAAVWGPAIVRAWIPLKHDVFAYSGVKVFRIWGLVELGKWTGVRLLTVWLPGPGRFLAVAAAALISAALLLRRPDRAVEAAGLSMCLFFVLSPAFAPQYLAWVVAPAYLVSLWSATFYNLSSGALAYLIELAGRTGFSFEVFHRRISFGSKWDVGRGHPFTNFEIAVAMVAWLSLVAVAVEGVRLILRRPMDEVDEQVPGRGSLI